MQNELSRLVTKIKEQDHISKHTNWSLINKKKIPKIEQLNLRGQHQNLVSDLISAGNAGQPSTYEAANGVRLTKLISLHTRMKLM